MDLKTFVAQTSGKKISNKKAIGVLLDLVCRRYPGRRPSDYLELDEWEGFQFDIALALKSELLDRENQANQLDVVRIGIDNICRGLGMKVKSKKRKPLIESEDMKPSAEQLVAGLGGKGVVIERNKK